MTELKPCPFCGGSARMHSDYSERNSAYYFYIQCQNCYARSKTIKTEMDEKDNEKAVKAWNMRAYEGEKEENK